VQSLARSSSAAQPVGDDKINNGKIDVPAILLPPVAVDRANLDDVIKDYPREDVSTAT
jgi:D-xylose transport system substrate-binding protein